MPPVPFQSNSSASGSTAAGFAPPLAAPVGESTQAGVAKILHQIALPAPPALSEAQIDHLLTGFSKALALAAADPAAKTFRLKLLEEQKAGSGSHDIKAAEYNYRIVFDSLVKKHLRKQVPELNGVTENGVRYLREANMMLDIYHSSRQREAAALLTRTARKSPTPQPARSATLSGFAAAGKAMMRNYSTRLRHKLADAVVSLGETIRPQTPSPAGLPARGIAPKL